ncbi:polysaccharide biosynthesis tyrosine autokinase [Microbacterium horticulturae]|uniref:Polysaccharide biosynthesis tyrosine autokinase n=1 Tax=Microbacterium horticulturae TaxID=3028316 RepID=A0ABY8BVG1_9MICO|nr:polysaccharide biosynthesis tyrosine autokinase [Microbacterium sp. KACC 23027]WEG08168.1 polysaccharide biosynthesis tyrosine autokinase [Microbacterium sp. KACC 23027]
MELRDYLRIMRAHWIGIVLLTLLGIAVAAGWTLVQPRIYTATTSGFVSIPQVAAEDTGTALTGNQLAMAKVKSFVDVGTWRSVADYAIDELHLKTSPEDLVKQVDVTNPLDTVIIQVSANATTPEAARDLAEAWVRGMQNQIAQIEGNGADDSSAVTLIPGDSAQLPAFPSSPNVKLALALGALLGLAVGVGYAVLRHVLDRRLHDPRDIEHQTGATVVGTIPLEKSLTVERGVLTFNGSRQAQNSTIVAESMRELRTNLQFMDVDHPPRVVVVTSPLPGDGKSTTAANLAVSLAATGQRVMLIDADLRRPVVASMFGLPEGAGLSDLLAGRAALADVVHVPDPSGNLVVLPAGRIPPNPSEMLGSHRMRELLTSLSKEAMIIIDSPPTVPVTDAAVLSTSADGALVVVSAGRTTYDVLQKALENLHRAHGKVLGVVLNKMPRKGAGSGYYYGYGYYYSEDEGAAPTGTPGKPAKATKATKATAESAGPRRASAPAASASATRAVAPEAAPAARPVRSESAAPLPAKPGTSVEDLLGLS